MVEKEFKTEVKECAFYWVLNEVWKMVMIAWRMQASLSNLCTVPGGYKALPEPF
jgi:hypothetical protein